MAQETCCLETLKMRHRIRGIIKMDDIQKQLIQYGAKYLNITPGEFVKRMTDNIGMGVNDWNKYGISEFYNKTSVYIYSLVNFNSNLRIDNLLHPIKHLRNLKILDYGAGIGIIPILLAKHNTTYYYDVESKTKEFAKYLNNDSKYKTTIIDTPEKALGLDLDMIICVDVLEHLEKPMTLVKEITKSLPKGGLFLTTGLDFSVGEHIPMHLVNNKNYKAEYDRYMNENYRLVFFHITKNELIYLWSKY